MESFAGFEAIAAAIDCPPYVFRIACFDCVVRCNHPDRHVWFVQACLWRKDTDTGLDGWGLGGQLVIRASMSDNEIVRKFFVAARDYSEHEVREAFTYRGRRILGPHIGVDALMAACDRQ